MDDSCEILGSSDEQISDEGESDDGRRSESKGDIDWSDNEACEPLPEEPVASNPAPPPFQAYGAIQDWISFQRLASETDNLVEMGREQLARRCMLNFRNSVEGFRPCRRQHYEFFHNIPSRAQIVRHRTSLIRIASHVLSKKRDEDFFLAVRIFDHVLSMTANKPNAPSNASARTRRRANDKKKILQADLIGCRKSRLCQLMAGCTMLASKLGNVRHVSLKLCADTIKTDRSETMNTENRVFSVVLQHNHIVFAPTIPEILRTVLNPTHAKSFSTTMSRLESVKSATQSDTFLFPTVASKRIRAPTQNSDQEEMDQITKTRAFVTQLATYIASLALLDHSMLQVHEEEIASASLWIASKIASSTGIAGAEDCLIVSSSSPQSCIAEMLDCSNNTHPSQMLRNDTNQQAATEQIAIQPNLQIVKMLLDSAEQCATPRGTDVPLNKELRVMEMLQEFSSSQKGPQSKTVSVQAILRAVKKRIKV